MKSLIVRSLSVEDKAGCLRKLLNQLPETIFPLCQKEALHDFADMINRTAQSTTFDNVVKALRILVYYIPDAHKLCLRKLLIHLDEINRRRDRNAMDLENLGILFIPIIFPTLLSSDERQQPKPTAQEVKSDLEVFKKMFVLLIEHRTELFSLPDEIIDTLGSTIDANPSLDQSSPSEDPEIQMSVTYVDRNSTPTQPNTDHEMAKLMATIREMPEGLQKKKLIKRMQISQRAKAGVVVKKRRFIDKIFSA